MIDYILNVTLQPKLNWIGYSLGTAVGLGLTSSIPEYNDKINSMVLLATTAYVGNARSPLIRPLTKFQYLFDVYLNQALFPP